MVTDAKRSRIIMASGADYGRLPSIDSPVRRTSMLTDVWEWNGSTSTWTDVSPPVGWGRSPDNRCRRLWDTARSKLVAMDDNSGLRVLRMGSVLACLGIHRHRSGPARAFIRGHLRFHSATHGGLGPKLRRCSDARRPSHRSWMRLASCGLHELCLRPCSSAT